MSKNRRTKGSRKRSSSSLAQAMARHGIKLTHVSQEEADRERVRRKRELGLFDWDEVDQLEFPEYFTVFYDYMATGEGSTRGITMCHAATPKFLRDRADKDLGAYFAQAPKSAEG